MSDAPDQFILLIDEPAHSLQRAVQVRGLPFRIGSSSSAAVRLKTRGIPTVRVEAMGNRHRVVDEGGYVLRVGGQSTPSAPLRHGASFHLGGVSVRFLVGTVDSLRSSAPAKPQVQAPPRLVQDDPFELDLSGDAAARPAPAPAPLPSQTAPPAPPPPSIALPAPPPPAARPIQVPLPEYLARLDDLKRRLAELVPSFAAEARAHRVNQPGVMPAPAPQALGLP